MVAFEWQSKRERLMAINYLPRSARSIKTTESLTTKESLLPIQMKSLKRALMGLSLVYLMLMVGAVLSATIAELHSTDSIV